MAGWLVWHLRQELTPFFLAFVLAYAIEPSVQKLTERGWSRPVAILALYAAALVLVAGTGSVVAPVFFRETGRIIRNLPGYLNQFEIWRRSLEGGYRQAPWPGFVRLALDEGFRNWGNEASRLIRQSVTGLMLSAPGVFMDLILVPVLCYYFLRDGQKWRHWVFELVPCAHRGRVAVLLLEFNETWGGFLRGQLAVAAVIAAVSTVFLHFLGVRYSLLLGLLSGLGDLIPYFGPIIGGVAAVAVALERSPLTALLVGLSFLLLQWVEENLLSPRLLGDQLRLHPVAVIAALLAGGELGGLWGLFVAVPVAGMLRPLGEFIRYLLESPGD